MRNGHIEILPTISKFQNALNSITDLYDISLICTKFGAFIIIAVIVPKGCTYPPDCYKVHQISQGLSYALINQLFVPYGKIFGLQTKVRIFSVWNEQLVNKSFIV